MDQPTLLVGAAMLFDSMLVRFAGAYLLALGLAVRLEKSTSTPIGWRRWLKTPIALAAGLWAASLGVRGALQPYTLVGQIEGQIKRSAVTGKAHTLDLRSGVVRAFALVPQDTSVVLVGYSDGAPTLERFGGESPRKRIWQVPLPAGRLDHRAPISLVVSNNGKRIGVMTERRTAIVDGDTGKLIREVDQCDEVVRGRGDHALAFSPDGRTLAVGQGSLCLGPVDSPEVDVTIPRSETDSKQVHNLLFSPNGEQLWVAFNNTIECWDIAEGKRLISIASDSSQFALSHDGRRVATFGKYGQREQSIEVRDAASGEKLYQVDEPGTSRLRGPMAYLPDNRHVVVLGRHTFTVIEPETGRFREMGPGYQGLAVSAPRNLVVFSASATAGDSTPTMQFIPVPELFAKPAREGTR